MNEEGYEVGLPFPKERRIGGRRKRRSRRCGSRK